MLNIEKNWVCFDEYSNFSNKNGASPKLFEIGFLIGNAWAIVNQFLIWIIKVFQK